MAGGMDLGTQSRGGKRALDAAINLVPFIDLMAVTISFLIMTAVWTQIGRLQVSQSGGAPGDDSREASLPLTLAISDRQLRLTFGGSALDPIPLARDPRGRLELAALAKQLAEIKASRPEQQAIVLEAEDSVRYDDLVRIIDACIGDGLTSVQVAGSG